MPLIRAADLELTRDELAAVTARFGVRAMEPLGGYENLLFRSTDPGGVVLRVTHTSRRSPEEVLGEVEFLEHLAAEGCSVVRPVRSTDGELCVEWTTGKGEPVLTMAMTEAPGARRRPALWAEPEIETYGRTLAELHRAARSFEPSRPAHRRPSWFDPRLDPGYGDDPLRQRHDQLVERARALPAGGTDLLIHMDAHHGNLHLTEDGVLTLFDFDDCAYSTPTHDLALCIYYWFFRAEDHGLEAARSFTRPFLRGYASVQPLPDDWPRGVDEFLSLREVDLLFLLQSSPIDDPGVPGFMERARRHIESDAPYLDAPAEEWATP